MTFARSKRTSKKMKTTIKRVDKKSQGNVLTRMITVTPTIAMAITIAKAKKEMTIPIKTTTR